MTNVAEFSKEGNGSKRAVFLWWINQSLDIMYSAALTHSRNKLQMKNQKSQLSLLTQALKNVAYFLMDYMALQPYDCESIQFYKKANSKSSKVFKAGDSLYILIFFSFQLHNDVAIYFSLASTILFAYVLCVLRFWYFTKRLMYHASGGRCNVINKQTNKLHGLSPRANYTDRATAACRRSDCQLLRIKGATWSA
jgi:hypothetical protein